MELAWRKDGKNLCTTPDLWNLNALQADDHEQTQPVLRFVSEVLQEFDKNRIWSEGLTVFE